jgi:predicted Mrr-cat superfamily restriction endonuclease
MIGIIESLEESDGIVSVEGLGRSIFFHEKSLVGVFFEEVRVGDVVSLEIEVIPRKEASPETLRHGELVLPYGQQTIVPPRSNDELTLQNKISAEFIVRLSKNPSGLYELSPQDFEELVGEIFRIDGYSVELIGSWNEADGGVDILAMKSTIGAVQVRMALQCKRYAKSKRVTAGPIRELAGVLDRFHAHAGAVITTSDFTKPAKREAAAFFWQISLLNFESIVDMLRQAELLLKPPITFSREPIKPPAIPEPDIPEMFMTAVNIQRA